jgi:hypothetical protein
MTIREACDLVVTAASHALAPNAGDTSVYVLEMGQPVKIVDLAERMIRLSGLEPGRDIEVVFSGIRPGERTATHIDYVLTRITLVGALYLTFVCLLPEFLISYAALPFYLGGTSILIVVSVTMDTVAQVQGYLIAHQYEGLIKKAKLRGSKR